MAKNVNTLERLNKTCKTLEEMNEGDFIRRIFYNALPYHKRIDFGYLGGFLYTCTVELDATDNVIICGIAYIVGINHVLKANFRCRARDFNDGTFDVKEVI